MAFRERLVFRTRTFQSTYVLALSAALASATCAAPLLKLPSGLGSANDNGGNAYFEARRQCQFVTTLTTELELRGWAGGHRLDARIWAGTMFPEMVRLQSNPSSSQSQFILTATRDEATLLLPQADRVVSRESASAVVEAVTVIPLNATDFEGLITGCPRISASIESREKRPTR
jgi:hypothetical protein